MITHTKTLSLIMAALLALTLMPSEPATVTAVARISQTAGLGNDGMHRQEILDSYASLPLSFEENRGQFDEPVRFVARHAGGVFFFASQEVAIVFTRKFSDKTGSSSSGRRDPFGVHNAGVGSRLERISRSQRFGQFALKVRFVSASPSTRVEGLEELPGKANYFLGDDPLKWQRGVPTYRKIVYREVYPGTDLACYGVNGQLKYNFVLQPGAAVEQIELAYVGTDGLRVNKSEQLEIETAWGVLLQKTPLAWQEVGGQRMPVEVHYALRSRGRLSFAVGQYDPDKPLVIEAGDEPQRSEQEKRDSDRLLVANPTLTYSTFVGGNSDEGSRSLVVDNAGNLVMTGATLSPDFPTIAGAYDESYNGSDGSGYWSRGDVFVSKLSSDGSALLYSTYIGGSGDEAGYSLALDGAGNVIVTGGTFSSDFPTTTGAYDTSYNGGNPSNWCDGGDVFVSKLSADGKSLLYSTFVGGTNPDYGCSLALDTIGNAVVTGMTHSSDFPITLEAYDGDFNGGREDVFVLKLSVDGKSLLYSSFVGGSSNEYGYSLALDGLGNAVVTGETESSNFPTTVGAYDRSHNGGWDDVFVLKLSADGKSLLYSTFVGGGGLDWGKSLVLDSAGNVVVAGITQSSNFPTTAGAYDTTYNGDQDVFVFKLSDDGSSLLYSSFMGGSGADAGLSLALDSAENAVVTGGSVSSDFPTTPLAYDGSYNGSKDVFVFKLSPSGDSLLYSTFVGGSRNDGGCSLVLDAGGNIVVIGGTASSDFPTTPDAYDMVYNGGNSDIFVAKLAATYSISGHVRDGSGDPISGATVSAGSEGSATTDANGAYILGGLAAGTYTLTPRKNKWKFTPATRTVSVPPSATRHDFIGTLEGVPFFVAINDDGEMYAFPVLDEPHYGYLIGTGSVAAVADFDNDSFCEVLAVRKSDRLLRLYESVDGTSFFEKVVSEDAYPSALVAFSDSVAGDFDNNHLLDFAFTGRRCSYSTEYCSPGGQGLIQVHLNRGKGHFDRRSIDINGILDRRWEGMKGLDDGDFNLDGSLDLAAQQYWGGADNVTHLLLGNGDGTFVDSLSFTNANSNGTVSLVSGDFNNDGYLDLIVGQDDGGDPGQTWLYLGNGTGAFTYYGPAYDTNPADESGDNEPGAGHADAYDFDSDGNLDVVAIAKGIGVLLFKGSGDGSFQTPLILKSGVNWGGVATPPDSQPRCKWGSGPGPTYFISGHVRDGNGDPISGVTVSASAGGSDVTDAGGFYVISRLVTGTYMLAPSKSGYAFSPPMRTVTVPPDATDQDFSGWRPPIVLVHGFQGFSTKTWHCSDGVVLNAKGVVHTFGDMAQWFEEEGIGYDVWIAHLNSGPFGTPSIEQNAQCLKNQVASVRQQTGQKVILVAHSMGGLVSRACLNLNDCRDNVTALYTLGSPHAGINAAFLLRLLARFKAPVAEELICNWQPALCQFTTDGILWFNLSNPNRDSIDYHFIGGDKTPFPWGWILWPLDGPNDGRVGRHSAVGWLYPTKLNVVRGPEAGRYWTNETHSEGVGQPTYFEASDGGRSAAFRCIAWGDCTEAANLAPSAVWTEPVLSATTIDLVGHLASGQSASHTLQVDTSEHSLFFLSWLTGTLSFTLTQPNGQVITPAYADAHPAVVTYTASMGDNSTPPFAAYAFTSTIPGSYTLAMGAENAGSGGTNYLAFAALETTRVFSVTTSTNLYQVGQIATFTGTLHGPSGGITGAAVQATLVHSDNVTETLSFDDLGSGFYSAAWTVPDVPGYLQATITALGDDSGTAFTRQVDKLLAIAPHTTWLADTYADRPEDRDGDGFNDTLALDVGVAATQVGTYTLSADLAAAGQTVAHATHYAVLAAGAQTVTLQFDGWDIRQSHRDGPYTVTHVYLVDVGVGGIPAQVVDDVWVTAAYEWRDFGFDNLYLPLTLRNR